MSTKFNLHTPQGLADFTDFAEGVIRQDLRRILEASPQATGEEVADHFASTAENHYQGAPGYWGLAPGGFTTLTNDPTAERAAFIEVGDRLIRESAVKSS